MTQNCVVKGLCCWMVLSWCPISSSSAFFLSPTTPTTLQSSRTPTVPPLQLSSSSASSSSTAAAEITDTTTTTTTTVVPKLIVFDLDQTLWTPELYQLRQLQRQRQQPIAHKDVTLFPAIEKILTQLQQQQHTSTQFAHTKFAIAFRTNHQVAWAHNLLHQFGLESLFEYIEIFPGTLQCFDKRGRTSCRNSTRAIELSCPSRSFYCVDTYLSRPSFFPSFFFDPKETHSRIITLP